MNDETEFYLSCPHDWKGEGCNKEHVIFYDSVKPLCGRDLLPRRFDAGMESGDIACQETMDDLSDRGHLNHSICKTCLSSLINIGETYNVKVKPKVLVL